MKHRPESAIPKRRIVTLEPGTSSPTTISNHRGPHVRASDNSWAAVGDPGGMVRLGNTRLIDGAECRLTPAIRRNAASMNLGHVVVTSDCARGIILPNLKEAFRSLQARSTEWQRRERNKTKLTARIWVSKRRCGPPQISFAGTWTQPSINT